MALRDAKLIAFDSMHDVVIHKADDFDMLLELDLFAVRSANLTLTCRAVAIVDR